MNREGVNEWHIFLLVSCLFSIARSHLFLALLVGPHFFLEEQKVHSHRDDEEERNHDYHGRRSVPKMIAVNRPQELDLLDAKKKKKKKKW